MFEQEKKELCRICHLLYQKELVSAADGNVSRKTEDGFMLLTPSGKHKGMLEPEEILVLDRSGEVREGNGRPSKEFPMHRAVYEHRPEVKAVIHTHPVYTTAFALAGRNLPEDHLIEMPMMLGRTALAPFALPGTEEMAEAVKPYLEECSAILLKNHGALTMGKNLTEAFCRMEVMESIAKTILLSAVLGKPERILAEDMEKMRK